MSFKVTLVTLCLVAAATSHGTSYTKLSKPHQSKFDYKIEHSKHGSWHGSAHPHGYGGFGDSHDRSKRSSHEAWSKTIFSKPHEGKFEYDIEHSKHGSWHGSAHPDGYGGLGDGTGSYRLGDHSKVIGALPQGGGYSWGRSKRSAEGGYSKTAFSKHDEGKFEYDIEHSKHGSWHGSAHPDGYGGLGDGTGSYRLGDHSKVIGALPQGGGYSWGRSKRSAEGGYSKTAFSKHDEGKFEYDIEHSKHGSWHGSAHPDGYGGLGDGTGSYRLGGHSKVLGALPQGGGYSWGRSKRSAEGGYSKTSFSKHDEGKFEYDIEHSKHGSWHGSAHPDGYGGLGDGTGSYRLGGHSKVLGALPQGGGYSWGRSKRSAEGGYSKTSFSKHDEGKFEYDIEHSKHGSWHGSAHPDGYGGLGDGTGSYRLGDHSKVIGALPQGGGYSWGRSKRSAEGGYSKTSFSKHDEGKFEYDIEHSKHGSWHGSAHPDGYGGLGDGTGSYRLGGHSKVLGALPQGGGYSWGRSKRSAEGGYSKTSFSKHDEGKFEYDIEHSKHGSWHGSAHPDGYGGLGDGTGSYRLGDHSKVIGALPQGGGYSWGRSKRSAEGGYSKTSFSKHDEGTFEYDIEHSKHGSWHGSAHPDGYGGLGDGTGSYRLGDHSKVIGALPQGGGHSWGRSKRSAEGGYSKTSVSRPHSDKYSYEIEHKHHGSWHGYSHPHGYGGL
ncbi:hypothetical protein GE061_002190 [Apolygus lucorum]|uniref:Uncharacterized protein n=1 Tax=Apolygus lucorum TaxID=248454 RepID=A0A8S9X8G5_APOLU|nr:hypothetical protein GE061_002190 [Apolygus lucorum]